MRFIRVPLEVAVPFLLLALWLTTWPLWWNACSQSVDLNPAATCIVHGSGQP